MQTPKIPPTSILKISDVCLSHGKAFIAAVRKVSGKRSPAIGMVEDAAGLSCYAWDPAEATKDPGEAEAAGNLVIAIMRKSGRTCFEYDGIILQRI